MPVVPKCNSGHFPYVDSSGFLFPCCWIASAQALSKLKDFLGEKFEQLDLSKKEFAEIMQSEAMKMIENSWSDGSFEVCKNYCWDDNTEQKNTHHVDQEIVISLRDRF